MGGEQTEHGDRADLVVAPPVSGQPGEGSPGPRFDFGHGLLDVLRLGGVGGEILAAPHGPLGQKGVALDERRRQHDERGQGGGGQRPDRPPRSRDQCHRLPRATPHNRIAKIWKPPIRRCSGASSFAPSSVNSTAPALPPAEEKKPQTRRRRRGRRARRGESGLTHTARRRRAASAGPPPAPCPQRQAP